MISDISLPFILYSYFLSYQGLIITFFYLTHPTVTHDLTPFSIRRRCRSVLDHLGCAFIYLLDFRFNIFHDGRAWQIVDLLVLMLSFWQSACWVLICLFFAFRALVIIVFIRQSFLFSQHGITIHSPVWHYLFEVGHFHYMMDEHISEYSSFEAFCFSVCSSLHTGAYPISESMGPSTGFIHFWSSCRPRELHTGAYPPSPRSSDLSQASLSFDLVVDPYELSY